MSMNQKKITEKSINILKDYNIPITRPRILLLEILLKNKGPLRVEDVIKLSKNKIAISSLYRIINMLKNLNLISEFQTPDNTKVIELSDINDNDHHHHIFCNTCGAVNDFALNDNLEEKLKEEIKIIESIRNISILSHSLELISTCNNCKT